MAIQSYTNFLLGALFLLFIQPFAVYAERVKPLNPDCAACLVVISYEGSEAKEVVGTEGQSLILKLDAISSPKSIKIDLDGKKKPGPGDSNDPDYELLVYIYPHLIAINAIKDSSTLSIKTDIKSLKSFKDQNKWNPEIQIATSQGLDISRSDTLDIAWLKCNASMIYEYVNGNSDHKEWNGNFRTFIIDILKVATQQ
ncbi:MAG: hypothetical protein JEZ12_22900 [Desulfobacterium sp.]|nr:hypothetical protein [Desulfobacterium sp.]